LFHRIAAIAAILAASATVHAQTEEPEDPEDLAELEAAIGADQADQAPPPAPAKPSFNPDISLVLDIAFAWFSDEAANLQTGGHDPTANGFNLQQLELSFSKSVDPYFKFDSHLVFGPDGFELEEAYATTTSLPSALQARVGAFLTQFGRLNATHPHSWDFVDQPFAIGRVLGGDGDRGLGAELSYLTPLPFYTMVIASITNPHDDSGVESPLDLQKTVAVKEFFELSHDWSLLTGQSFASGANAFGNETRTDLYGADLYLKWRPITRQSEQQVTLQTEWILRRAQVGSARLTDVSGYAQTAWRFAKRWQAAARWDFGTPADVPDPVDPDWTEDRHRATANLTFWPTEFSRLRAQGSVDLAAWQDPVWATFLAMEVTVGAHGAHVF
jgi:hypothetical protein